MVEMADSHPFRYEHKVGEAGVKRRNSADLLPPNMSGSPSDLRIVLLARNVSGKSAVGNIILNIHAFHHDYVLNQCIRVSGEVEGRHITVINTPDLLDPDISHDKFSKELRWIKTLSEPGPHVFLLVLQPEVFIEEERNRIRNILDNLSEWSLDYSMVLTTDADKRGRRQGNQALNLMIQECRGRPCLVNLSDRNHLMTCIDQMVKDNGGAYVTLEVFEDTTSSLPQDNREKHVGKDILEQTEPKKSIMDKVMQSGWSSFLKQREDQPSSGNQLSSLRIVLLGRSDVKKKRLGNLILQKDVFKAPRFNEQQCDSASGKMNDKSITVIKTPDLFSMSGESMMMEMEKCKSLTAPGPHVLLLVLKPEEFTEQKINNLKWILSLFGKDAFKHSIVIITHKRDAENPQQNQVIDKCGGRFYYMDSQGSDHKELTGKIEKMVEENECRYLTYNEVTTHDPMPPKGQQLHLVLCGRSGAGKTSVSNALLGQTESMSSSVCVKKEGEICGQLVSIIKMPALYLTHLTQEEVMRESFRCISLCEPGVHVFLLVVPVGPLTDADKGEMETIQNILGPQVNDFTMVLFRQDYIPVDKTTVDFLEQNEDTKQLIKTCGGRYNIFVASEIKNTKQTTELLEDIGKMLVINKSFYTFHMYAEAQNRRIVELNEKISNMSQVVSHLSPTDCLRMVLIGKTGNGKSASANTILGREEFESSSSLNSVTTVCRKAVSKVDGRTVAVVDTPGLFDTGLSNEDVQQEIVKCVSLSAPGPHVFIIVLSMGRITQEEMNTLDLIEKTFGQQAGMFSLVLFTRGDELTKSITENLKECKNDKLKKLIRDCGDRVHVFNNKDKDRTQVTELYKMIDNMVSENKCSFYTSEMFQEAEAAIKQKQAEILKKKELEIKADMEKLKVQHETEMEKIKSKLEEERLKVHEERELGEKKLKDREDAIRKEHEEKEEKEKEERRRKDENRKKEEELERKIWDKEKEEMEKEIKSQKEKLEKQHIEKEKEYHMIIMQQKREEREREELLEKQERQFAELKRKQEEEMERREKAEQERRKNEEKDRQEWQRKIEEAEKGQTEMQQDMLKQKYKWEEQLKKEKDRQQEEERLRREKETKTIKQQEEEQRRLREEFEREKERDRIKNNELEVQRREMEQKERDRIEKEFEEKRREWTNKMTMMQEDWEKQRREEWERRHQEDLNRRKEEERRLKEVEEHFRQEREEENMRREKEDKVRREQEQKKLKEIEAEYERRRKEMISKYEEEARKHAEEFNLFREKHERCLVEYEEEKKKLEQKHKKEYDDLISLYGHDKKELSDKIRKMEKEHEEEIKHLYKCVIL